jgi:hypothetical protein
LSSSSSLIPPRLLVLVLRYRATFLHPLRASLSDLSLWQKVLSMAFYRLGYGPGMDYQKRIFLSCSEHHTWVDFHRLPSLASRAWVILYNSSAAGSNLHGSRPAYEFAFTRRPSIEWFRWAALPWPFGILDGAWALRLVSHDTWLYRLIEFTTLHFSQHLALCTMTLALSRDCVIRPVGAVEVVLVEPYGGQPAPSWACRRW